MTKNQAIKLIIKETGKERNTEIFDKLSDMSEQYLTKLLKVIKGL